MPIQWKATASVIFKPVWVAIVGLATLQLATTIKPAHAFNVTYNFAVQIDSDAYETQGLSKGTVEKGHLTYDNAALAVIGNDEYASPLNGNLTLEFNFLNSIYTEKNDLNYGNLSYAPDYPAFRFTDGKLVGLDFFVIPSQFQPPQKALSFRIFNDAFYVGGTDNFNSGDKVGTVTYSDTAVPEPPPAGSGVAAVPEPSEVGGAIVASSLLGVWALKKVKQKN